MFGHVFFKAFVVSVLAKFSRRFHFIIGEKITDDEVAAVLHTLFSGKPGPLQQRFSANPIRKRGVVGSTIGATAPLGKSKPALG